MVKHFTPVQLRAALEVPGLQKTVRTSIKRHMRANGTLSAEQHTALIKLSAGAKTILKTETTWRTYNSLYLLKLCFRQRCAINAFCYVINDAGRAHLKHEPAQ
jgi:hypothetical protein